MDRNGSSIAAKVTRVFLRGLVVVVPFTITLYLLFWVFALLDNVMRVLLTILLPDELYFPGVGLICIVAVIFGMGIAMKEIHIGKFVRLMERTLLKVPLLKSVYSISKDFLEYMASDREKRSMGQVVSVSFDEAGCKLVGFMTEEHPGKHSPLLEREDNVAVYLPMGYQIGGYTIIVSRNRVQTLNMSFEEAMRFILTAGVSHEEVASVG